MKKVVNFISPVIEDRLSQSRTEDHINTEQVTPHSKSRGEGNAKTFEQDCLQWLLELSRAKGGPTVSSITQKALGFVFAFDHQMPMVRLLIMTVD